VVIENLYITYYVPVIALLADWLEVDLVELCFYGHLLVARGAGKVVDAPGLVERGEHVALDDLVAHVAEVAKQLVVVRLAVGQALALVVTVTEERLLALGAHKVLHVPMLAYKGHEYVFTDFWPNRQHMAYLVQ
jgi:hypothetical protein